METLSGELRNVLAATIKAARRAGDAGARKALGMLAVGHARAHESMSAGEQELRRRLRAHGRQLRDRRDPSKGTQAIDRLAHEVAYEHWHRMLFARFLAENDLLIEPESGVAVSLAECEELAREQEQDRWTVAGQFAERMLPQIFRNADPGLKVRLAPETRQELERLLESLPPAVFAARDSLGWTYQYWQAERKEAVNKSGVKIGADELPAVTQLFTERYMVLFLLHNTIGAWRAGRILAANPELAVTAVSEEELRRAVRLESHGSYDFEYLRFVREPRDGDEADQPAGPWRPAAGAFADWPRTTAELRALDPCCGSGHFLVESFDLLVRLRMEEERLTPDASVKAVLRDNLFGLEIDPRCTQIAAFNLALTAWRWPDAGGYRRLPELNLACSGLAPNATRSDWIALSEEAADAGGLPAKRDLLGVEDSLISAPLRNSLSALHDLFAQAPVLGSLIDPRALQSDLFQKSYESVRVLLGGLLERESTTDEQTERAVAAQFEIGSSYRKLREKLLKQRTWNLIARLGPGAFETIGGHVVNVALNVLSADGPQSGWRMAGIDVSAPRGQRPFRAEEKAALLRAPSHGPDSSEDAIVVLIRQTQHLSAPKNIIQLNRPNSMEILGIHAFVRGGTTTGDSLRFRRSFWEINSVDADWTFQQSTVKGSVRYAGREHCLLWQGGQDELSSLAAGRGATIAGREVWRRRGVAITYTGNCCGTLYMGEMFENVICVAVPRKVEHLAALWTFCESAEFAPAVRRNNQKLSVDVRYFETVEFDISQWLSVAAEMYPNGLPEPYSDDLTQWIFHGHPCGSVVWNDETK